MGLLTTTVLPTGRLLDVTRDTSPATAAAAGLSARVWAVPDLRPETVRGLLVHSARWAPAMCERCRGSRKGDVQRRLRCFGYGVPEEAAALRSVESRATMIYEGSLITFKVVGSDVKSNEMHVHQLPWPVAELERLGEASVTMRVTLSYFIEPSPGRRGWQDRHRYASHGLRFDVKRPTESDANFRGRVSAAVERPDEGDGGSEGQPWVVGTKKRTQGSIPSDWWPGTAAELAAAGELAVYPVTGWWRERRHLGRTASPASYSLIVSLKTDAEEAALYSEIAVTGVVPITT